MTNYNPIKIAHTLADAYGHGWTKYVSLAQAEAIFAAEGGDIAAAAAEVNRIASTAEDAEGLETWQRCTGLATAGAPNSYFSHQTASGRTRWQIGEQTMTIQITRPGDVVVASASLTATSLEIAWPGLDLAILGLRHIQAMAIPLDALYQAQLLDVEAPAYVPPPTLDCGLNLQALLSWTAAADAHLCAARVVASIQLGHLGDFSENLARVAQDVIDDAARVALRARGVE